MRWFLLLGGLGILGFIAEFIDEDFPNSLLFVAFVSCIVVGCQLTTVGAARRASVAAADRRSV